MKYAICIGQMYVSVSADMIYAIQGVQMSGFISSDTKPDIQGRATGMRQWGA